MKELKDMTKEEKHEYFRKEKENKVKAIADEFLEQAKLPEINEAYIDKKMWLLKNIAVRKGYITSAEVKEYLLENYK